MQFKVLIQGLCLKHVLTKFAIYFALDVHLLSVFFFLDVCEIGGLLVILIESLTF